MLLLMVAACLEAATPRSAMPVLTHSSWIREASRCQAFGKSMPRVLWSKRYGGAYLAVRTIVGGLRGAAQDRNLHVGDHGPVV